jgi:hypothetical protein
MARVLASIMLAAVDILVAGVMPAHSQPAAFTCPKAGTVAQYELGKVLYKGATPTDPYNCVIINLFGKEVTRLFNFYPGDLPEYATVKAAMIPLFLKQVQSVVFVFTAVSNRNQYKHTWNFLRKETITFDSRKIDADVYEVRVQGQLGNSFDGKWIWWFDPAMGIWIKSQFSLTSGVATGVTPPGGQLVSIIAP